MQVRVLPGAPRNNMKQLKWAAKKLLQLVAGVLVVLIFSFLMLKEWVTGSESVPEWLDKVFGWGENVLDKTFDYLDK